MSRRSKRRLEGRPALDLLEAAVHLVRTAPAAVLATYYLGTVPFVLAFLYFWSDMSRSAFAVERCAPLAGGLAVLFVWMKGWQTAFARLLREQIVGARLPALKPADWIQVIGSQTLWHATGLVVLPVASVIVFPSGWCIAFYQSLTAVGAAGTGGAQRPMRESLRHSRLWPGQNHAALGTLAGVGFVVLVNAMILLLTVPFLIKTLFGVETSFSQSAWTMANSTFVAAAAAVTWLAIDPVVKALYALRCFHGDALTNGEDVRVELRSFRREAGVIALLVMLLGLCGLNSRAAEASEPAVDPAAVAVREVSEPTAPAVAELDEAIDDVLQRREFAWRLPRGELAPAAVGESWLQRNIERILGWIGRQIRTVGRNVLEFIRWVFDKLFGDRLGPSRGSGAGWQDAVRALFVLLIIALVAALAYLGYRLWRNYRPLPVVEADAATGPPDLADDATTASQLPEDEWIRLGRELLARGEHRLAVRAFYLAGLAHLADRGLVTIARHKSNHEYERELGRRSHALPAVMDAFADHVTVFDRVWYGDHVPTPELVENFEANLRRIAAA